MQSQSHKINAAKSQTMRTKPSLLTSLISSEKSKVYICHGVVSLLSLLITGSITLASYLFALQSIKNWNQNIRHINKTEYNDYESYLNQLQEISDLEKLRINDLLLIIESRAKVHSSIARDYYVWLFTALCTATFSSIVAGICAFYISKEGWDKANNYSINLFFVLSGIAIFSGSLPQIFEHKSNINLHSSLYIEYINLEDQILTNLSLIETSKSEENTSNYPQLIKTIETKVETLNKFAVSFNTESIPFSNDLMIKSEQSQSD